MANIMKHTAVWAGFTGAPGYSNFYHHVIGTEAAAAQAGHDSVIALFFYLNGYLPSAVSVTVNPVAQIIDEFTGDLVGEVTVGTAGAVVTGNNGGNWAANSGFGIEWTTGLYLNGRALRGRTYVVPGTGAFDDEGSLSDAGITGILAAAQYLVGSSQAFGVWHRPVAGTGGLCYPIISATVRDKAYILRSRAI